MILNLQTQFSLLLPVSVFVDLVIGVVFVLRFCWCWGCCCCCISNMYVKNVYLFVSLRLPFQQKRNFLYSFVGPCCSFQGCLQNSGRLSLSLSLSLCFSVCLCVFMSVWFCRLAGVCTVYERSLSLTTIRQYQHQSAQLQTKSDLKLKSKSTISVFLFPIFFHCVFIIFCCCVSI